MADRATCSSPRQSGRRVLARDGDIDSARDLVAVGADHAELFVYPGNEHLFFDSSLPSYDADAAALVMQRTRQFSPCCDPR